MPKVLSLDLEIDQPSGKIIEVGYVIGDVHTRQILQRRDLIVNSHTTLGIIPGINVHISDYTGITQDMVNNGIELNDAYKIMCDDIKKYNPTVTCVQWGDGKGDNKGDHDYLRRELNLSWENFVFRPRAWDVKSQFQIWRTFQRQSVSCGLDKAMIMLDLEFKGRPHRAGDDAFNTFIVFCEIGSKSVKFDKIKKIV